MRTILLFLFTACVLLISGVADAAGPSVTRVILPVDQKLVDVSWRCDAGSCAPWFLTRLMGTKEATESYTFTAHDRMVLVIETREPGNWPWDSLTTVDLPSGQRLLRLSWRCDGGSCTPWFLTTPLGTTRARSYTFTDGSTVLLIHENDLE